MGWCAARWRIPSLIVAATSFAFRPLTAQSFSAGTNLVQSIPAPTAAEYNAASPNNVTAKNTTTNFSATITCPSGSGNPVCHLNLAFGTNPQGLQLQVQWQLTAVDNATNCGNPTVGGGFQGIPATAIVAVTSGKNCTVTFTFRVAGLSYAVQQAPGANGTTTPYAQNIVFSLTRP